VRFCCGTGGSTRATASPGREHIGDGLLIKVSLSRRSRSYWKRVSTWCVWVSNGGTGLTITYGRKSRTGRCSHWCGNLCALRGLDTIASAGLAAAIGDPSRFASASNFMAYIGLIPSEHSSGTQRHLGAITKTGDVHARTLLIEAAHCYRFPARIARHKLAAVDAVPDAVRVTAWKAQTRLCQRYRRKMAKGKPRQVVVTAIARELAGFVWAIACITSDAPATTSAVTPTSEEVGLTSRRTIIV